MKLYLCYEQARGGAGRRSSVVWREANPVESAPIHPRSRSASAPCLAGPGPLRSSLGSPARGPARRRAQHPGSRYAADQVRSIAMSPLLLLVSPYRPTKYRLHTHLCTVQASLCRFSAGVFRGPKTNMQKNMPALDLEDRYPGHNRVLSMLAQRGAGEGMDASQCGNDRPGFDMIAVNPKTA
jgi:hypothetical protein